MFVITGGGSGIGKDLALSLAQRGESVLIIGRREPLLQETAAQSHLISHLSADVSTDEGRESIRQHLKEIPRIKALVNNAGMLDPIIGINDINPEEWHRTLNTNLDAPLFLPQKLHAQLVGGRVLNIGSGAAYFAVKGWTAYCVSKAALSMLTRCWQLESDAIAFAGVMPGIIDTDMQATARSNSYMDPEQVKFYQSLKDHDRLIPTATVAQFLTWLLLDVDPEVYVSKEWDIYDTSHHAQWLRSPHQVLHWDF